MDITNGQHQNQIDYILCSQRWRSSIQSTKIRPGADCGSNHELLITKFRLQLKKVGKTARPFRYDLNQIPYDYTVEVRNRFKGLDLIDRVPHELWTEEPGRLQSLESQSVGHDQALYSQQKQDQELTVAQIMNSLLPNSDFN